MSSQGKKPWNMKEGKPMIGERGDRELGLGYSEIRILGTGWDHLQV